MASETNQEEDRGGGRNSRQAIQNSRADSRRSEEERERGKEREVEGGRGGKGEGEGEGGCTPDTCMTGDTSSQVLR